MTYNKFTKWLEASICEEKKFSTLGGRSQFYAQYDLRSNAIKIKNSKDNIWVINYEDLQRIFNRYVEAPQSMKHKAKYYNNPIWCETPNMIFAPYIPAIIRYCIEENE